MHDEYAIQRTISLYSQNASARKWDKVVPLFQPDAVWEVPHLGMKFEGQAAIRDALTMFSGTMEFVLQLNSPALIEVTGATATAQSGIRECGKSAGRDEGFEFFGFYFDNLVRTQDGWKFARRIFEGIGTNYFPLLPAKT